MYFKNILLAHLLHFVNSQCICQEQSPPEIMCVEEPYIDYWKVTPEEIVPYDILPPKLYVALYDNGGYNPGCPGGTTEDECIRMLGCSWCPWNNLGCVYKDVADLLPIPDGEEFCYSANEIGGGEPSNTQLFWFYYGRFYPPVVSRAGNKFDV